MNPISLRWSFQCEVLLAQDMGMGGTVYDRSQIEKMVGKGGDYAGAVSGIFLHTSWNCPLNAISAFVLSEAEVPKTRLLQAAARAQM
jgi:hypothetical protein